MLARPWCVLADGPAEMSAAAAAATSSKPTTFPDFMRSPKLVFSLLVPVALVAANPSGETRWVSKLRLNPEVVVVVAEGDLEPRSIGTVSVRAYRADAEAERKGFDLDAYVGGALCQREGVVESVSSADIDGDGRPELIVAMRSAGSGGWRSGVALTVRESRVEVVARVDDLPAGADVVRALRR